METFTYELIHPVTKKRIFHSSSNKDEFIQYIETITELREALTSYMFDAAPSRVNINTSSDDFSLYHNMVVNDVLPVYQGNNSVPSLSPKTQKQYKKLFNWLLNITKGKHSHSTISGLMQHIITHGLS